MRKIVASTLILAGTAVGPLIFPVASASAASCSAEVDYTDTLDVGGNSYGAFAWCETGEGYIRAKVTCVEEATFRQYAAIGPRVYSRLFFGNWLSSAYCRPGDAAINKIYILG